MATLGKKSTLRVTRLQSMLDHYLRVTLQDDRTFIGKMIAFDRHLNIVLSDCEEFRKIKTTGKTAGAETEEKRALGLILLRGEVIMTLKVEAPPPSSEKKYTAGGPNVSGLAAGPGIARGVGRGVPIAPVGIPHMASNIGLTAPVRGVGAPTPAAMNPQVPLGRAMISPQSIPHPMGRGQQGMDMGMGMMPMHPMMPLQQRPPPTGAHAMMGTPPNIPGIMMPTPLMRGMPMMDPSQQGFHSMQVMYSSFTLLFF